MFCWNLKVSFFVFFNFKKKKCLNAQREGKNRHFSRQTIKSPTKDREKKTSLRFMLILIDFLWENSNRAITPFQRGTFSQFEFIATGKKSGGKSNSCNQNNVFKWTSSNGYQWMNTYVMKLIKQCRAMAKWILLLNENKFMPQEVWTHKMKKTNDVDDVLGSECCKCQTADLINPWGKLPWLSTAKLSLWPPPTITGTM